MFFFLCANVWALEIPELWSVFNLTSRRSQSGKIDIKRDIWHFFSASNTTWILGLPKLKKAALHVYESKKDVKFFIRSRRSANPSCGKDSLSWKEGIVPAWACGNEKVEKDGKRYFCSVQDEFFLVFLTPKQRTMTHLLRFGPNVFFCNIVYQN